MLWDMINCPSGNVIRKYWVNQLPVSLHIFMVGGKEVISSLTVFFLILSVFLCVILPTVLSAIMVIRHKASWKAFIAGAIVFIIAQPLLRLPILGKLGDTAWFTLFYISNPMLYLILLGLSAGIFEEVGRFLGLRFMLKKELSWENGIVFGLGHGGAEAFILVGINYLAMISGFFRGETVISLLNTPPGLFLAGGIERILAITAHIGMTMLVLYSVKSGKKRYLFYAILFHTILDILIPVLKQAGLNLGVWGAEGYIAIFAIIAGVIIIKFKGIMAWETGVKDFPN